MQAKDFEGKPEVLEQFIKAFNAMQKTRLACADAFDYADCEYEGYNCARELSKLDIALHCYPNGWDRLEFDEGYESNFVAVKDIPWGTYGSIRIFKDGKFDYFTVY